MSYGTGSHLLADSLTGVTRTYTNGRLTGLTLGSDYGMTYGYDTYGRFGSINAQAAGTGAQTYTYSYLPNSDLLESLTSNHGLTVTRSSEPNRDVLTQVQNQFGTDIISQYDYISDELAQRTSMTTSGLAFDTSPDPVVEPGTTDYTTNNLNQYTSIQSSVSSIQLTYDLDGDLTNDGTFQYDYDAENRLISATPLDTASGLKKVEFAYDYMSRRVEKQVYTYDGSSWVLETEKSFVYDGWNLIKETTTDSGTSTDFYVWGMDVSGSLQGAGGIGGLLSKTNNLTSKTYLYTFDANGNVGQLVDSSTGAIAAHYEYDPFGNLVVAVGPEADKNVFRFSTKYYDVETGLYYYGFRYYDPVSGRWPTRDPLEEFGGLNLYGFVRNNPLAFFDPYGLQIVSHHGTQTAQGLCYTTEGFLDSLSMVTGDNSASGGIFDISGSLLQKLVNAPLMDEVRDNISERIVQEIFEKFLNNCCTSDHIRLDIYDDAGIVPFGGERRCWVGCSDNVLRPATDELTYVVRKTTVYWEAHGGSDVVCTGKTCQFDMNLGVRFHLKDPFDLRPGDRQTGLYNTIATVLAFLWHDVGLLAKDYSSFSGILVPRPVSDQWFHVADWNERLRLSGQVTCDSSSPGSYETEWNYYSKNEVCQ